MRRAFVPGKPKLLMLSHCVPDATGCSGRGRAWQLLTLAARTHQVCLVSLVDGPTSLAHWRRLDERARTVLVEPSLALRRLAGRTLRPLDAPGSEGLGTGRAFDAAVADQLGSQTFDAVLSTHVGLWRHTESVDAALRICDLHGRGGLWRRNAVKAEATGVAAAARRFLTRRYSRRCDLVERQIARTCDMVLLGHEEDLRRYATEPCDKLVLPEALDLSFFSSGARSDAAGEPTADRPRLLLHTDRRHRRWARRWFMRNVWPEVSRAVPNADVSFSGPRAGQTTVNQLQSASVVASPLHDPSLATWPVLQAMAAAMPVVAPRRTLEQLGARHGEHLLTPRRDKEWVAHCVDSLRDASIRVQLARGARSFVETHCGIGDAGSPLAAALRSGRTSSAQLADAA